jgi:hypothetical protein
MIIPLVSSSFSHREHHTKLSERRLFLIFLDNVAVVFDCVTVQDKYNARTLLTDTKISLHLMRNRTEKFDKFKYVQGTIASKWNSLHISVF